MIRTSLIRVLGASQMLLPAILIFSMGALVTRSVGSSFPVYIEVPATEFEARPFVKIDYTLTIPKATDGKPIAELVTTGPNAPSDLALGGGTCSYTLNPEGVIKGTWAGKPSTGRMIKFTFKSLKPISNASFPLEVICYDETNAIVPMTVLPGDTLTVFPQNPQIKVGIG